MKLVEIGPWTLQVDVEATRRAFDAVELAGPEKCNCSYCQNWVAARARVYTEPVKAYFESLGIDWKKEVRVTELPGMNYLGWTYVAGEVVSRPSSSSLDEHVHLTDEFLIYVSQAPWPPGMPAGPKFVALNFYAKAPWVLDEPIPPKS